MKSLITRGLARETRHWVNDELISQSQAEAICARYGLDYHTLEDGQWGYRLLVALSAVFVGLALIVLIGANWDDIPRTVRLGGLMAICAATQLLGLWRYYQGRDSAGLGLVLLGNLFFGAAIILIAQIYHLGEHMPDGIYWWAIGCLPAALLLREAWLMLLSLMLALIWFFTEASLGFFPVSLPLFIAAAGLVLLDRRSSKLLFMAAVVGLVAYIEVVLAYLWRDGIDLSPQVEHLPLTAILLYLGYEAGQWLCQHGPNAQQHYGEVLANWCRGVGLVMLFVFTFRESWVTLLEADWHNLGWLWTLSPVLALAAGWLAWRSGHWQRPLVILLPGLTALLLVTWTREPQWATALQVCANIALVAAAISLVVNGLRRHSGRSFFIGITTLLITGFARYVNLIGDYLGGAALFMVFALLMYGAARYWRHQQSREACHESH